MLPTTSPSTPDDADEGEVGRGVAGHESGEGVGHVQEDVGPAAVIAHNSARPGPLAGTWRQDPVDSDEPDAKQAGSAGQLAHGHHNASSVSGGKWAGQLAHQPVEEETREGAKSPEWEDKDAFQSQDGLRAGWDVGHAKLSKPVLAYERSPQLGLLPARLGLTEVLHDVEIYIRDLQGLLKPAPKRIGLLRPCQARPGSSADVSSEFPGDTA